MRFAVFEILRSRCTWIRVASLLALAGCASSPPAPAPPAASARPAPASSEPVAAVSALPALPTPAVLAAQAKGWGYLVDKLAADGLARERAALAFADPRVPEFDGLYFSPNPREPHSQYRHFLRRESVARAQRCAQAHAAALAAAERTYGVEASVVAAILHVETACGANTGQSLVLYRLARLAMANQPANVARNLSRWTGSDGMLELELAEQIRARARYLESVFYPQVIATFEVARQAGVDPLSIRGSSAGAFGFPQFLPLNYVAFAADGNGDGRVSLYDADDAIASCARFLASHGWRPGLPLAKRRQVVHAYNPSVPYIDTVLGLAARIDIGRALDLLATAEAAGAAGATVSKNP
jgi:membrane-bound lytic murein transglycosylase B